ncbi:hypothetical protein Trydic_g8286 [Trypoxylus dichotomus]
MAKLSVIVMTFPDVFFILPYNLLSFKKMLLISENNGERYLFDCLHWNSWSWKNNFLFSSSGGAQRLVQFLLFQLR